MEEEIALYLEDTKDTMEKALEHTKNELGKIRAGKASPAMLDGLRVDYYGSMSPISQVATVNTPDARTIVIKPWERTMLSEIEKAIRNSDLGLNPNNNGEQILLSIPPMTEERRRDLVKQSKQEVERGKISVRNIRKDSNESLRKLQKEGAAEDAIKSAEGDVQKLTDAYVAKLDELLVKKEAEIMTI